MHHGSACHKEQLTIHLYSCTCKAWRGNPHQFISSHSLAFCHHFILFPFSECYNRSKSWTPVPSNDLSKKTERNVLLNWQPLSRKDKISGQSSTFSTAFFGAGNSDRPKKEHDTFVFTASLPNCFTTSLHHQLQASIKTTQVSSWQWTMTYGHRLTIQSITNYNTSNKHKEMLKQ